MPGQARAPLRASPLCLAGCARRRPTRLAAPAPPAASQERQASGQLFKGFFEKSAEALYDEPPAQPPPAVDPAVDEAVADVLRRLEQQERRTSPLHRRGLLAAAVIGLLAVLLAVAARSWRLLPRAWLPLA